MEALKLMMKIVAIVVLAVLPAICAIAAGNQDVPSDSYNKVYIAEYTLKPLSIEFVVSNGANVDRDVSRWKVEVIRNGKVIASKQIDQIIDSHSGQVVTVDFRWRNRHFDKVALLATRDGIRKTRVASEVPDDMVWRRGTRVGRSCENGVWGWVVGS